MSGYLQVGSESQINHCLGVNPGGFLLAQGSSYCLRGWFQFPAGDALPSGSSSWTQRQAGKKDITRKFEVKMETAKVLCHVEVDKICLKTIFCSFPPKSCFGLSWFVSPHLPPKLKLLCLRLWAP